MAKKTKPYSVTVFFPTVQDRMVVGSKMLNWLEAVFPTTVLAFRCDIAPLAVSIFGDTKPAIKDISDEIEKELVPHLQEFINAYEKAQLAPVNPNVVTPRQVDTSNVDSNGGA